MKDTILLILCLFLNLNLFTQNIDSLEHLLETELPKDERIMHHTQLLGQN